MSAVYCLLLIMAPAPKTAEMPTGPAPTLQFVHGDGKGGIESIVTTTVLVPVTKTSQVNVNGVVRLVTTVVNETVTQSSVVRIDGKTVAFFDLDGKQIDEADWQKAIKDGVIVAKSADSNPPHRAYLAALKTGTLVMVAKPAVLPAKK